ncbi:MAG: type I-MYXAN CRISPR-associated protein Cas6/Cmx6 [Rudaea sp.]
MAEEDTDAVDVAYGVAGGALPIDHRFALKREVVRRLPWLEGEPLAGIHPLRGAPTDYGVVLLPRRARLVLRLPRRRVDDAMALAGQTLDVAGVRLDVGDASLRPLAAHGALYADCVVMPSASEDAFLAAVASLLDARGIRCECVCGRRRRFTAGEREIAGFGLLLHRLDADHSLILQWTGIGAERAMGCGLFLRHRLATPVGAA